MYRILGMCYLVLKVFLLVLTEIGFFPIICGWWLDICSLVCFTLFYHFFVFYPVARSITKYTTYAIINQMTRVCSLLTRDSIRFNYILFTISASVCFEFVAPYFFLYDVPNIIPFHALAYWYGLCLLFGFFCFGFTRSASSGRPLVFKKSE